LLKSLDAGWLGLRDVTATAYGDIVQIQRARADYVSDLRGQLEAEALACKHPDGWVEAELMRLIDG